MKISVVIPVYNAERSLRSTLDSVLGQTYHDWECICVDDGSVDASGSILDGYAAKDARFRVIHKENGGEGSARNAGMDAATGELIAFLDADDTWHNEALRLIAEARVSVGADVIRYGWKPVTEHTSDFEHLPSDVHGVSVDIKARNESTIRFCALGAATVVSKRACGHVRFSRLTQGADLVFVLDCLLISGNVAYIDAPLLRYLTHPGQISRKISKGLLVGSCGYLPEVVSRCARLGESDAAWRDTKKYVKALLFRRLFGAWRLIADPAGRNEVRHAFWGCLAGLAVQEGFFTSLRRRFVLMACRFESVVLLRLAMLLTGIHR